MIELGDSFINLQNNFTYNHKLLGELSLVNLNENVPSKLFERPYMYRMKISNYHADETFRKIFHQGLKFNHKNYLSPLHFTDSPEGTFLLLESFDTDLREQIKHRQKERIYFEEGELWGLAATLIEAISFLHEFDTFHGDVGPSVIVMSQYKTLKMLSPHLLCLKNLEKVPLENQSK